MHASINTDLFPFMVTNTSYGLDALWIKYKPQAAPWATVECQVMSPTTVVFRTYLGWNAQRELSAIFPMEIAPIDLAHYIDQRKNAIVNAVFAADELHREEARIAKRKAEIHAELFNKE